MVTINNNLEVKNSSKLRDFAKKFERPSPPEPSAEAPKPEPRANIFERLDLANKLELDNSIDDTIDVVPQTRFVFLYIVFNVMKLYKSIDQEHPLLTPSSLVSYCLFQVYAFFLINDYYGRPSTSYSASDFMNDDSRSQLLDMFAKSYVAPFMLTIFHALADCSDPRRPGLQYFATLAGSIFNIDFGRLIPAHIFLHSHNISTDEDTSRTPQVALQTLLNTLLFNIQGANNNAIHVSHYFSAGYDATHHHDSTFFEALRTLFSPVTGKSLLRRTNIQYVPISPNTINTAPTSDNAQQGNQYVTFLNADSQNVRHMFRFVAAMSPIVKAELKATFQLGAVPDDMNGVNILVHGYSQVALPTWHSVKHVAITATKLSHNSEEYATAIHFLLPAPSYTKKDLDYSVSKTLTGIMKTMLLGRDQPHDFTNGPKFVTFDEDIHVAPRTLYLDPYTHGDGPISYAMLAGLLIESFEIDGASVPQPDPRVGLSVNNKQFLQGALPLSLVQPGRKNQTHVSYRPYDRAVQRRGFQAINIDLYDMSRNRLGLVDDAVNDLNTDATLGFNVMEHARNFRELMSKISFSTDPNTIPSDNVVTFDAWSPYRYVSSQNDEYPQLRTTFMLVNRRTEYGTSIPLVGSRHPSVIIPIS